MKIESSDNSALAVLQTNAARAAKDNEAQASAGAAQGTSLTKAVNADSAEVNLSSMSALHAANGSDIDTAKVESIKAALRDGSYTIDSGKIADGMLSTARDLLQTKAR